MQIDIVSDPVCPWCFIGKRKLERALRERPDIKPTIAWKPFQLNPHMPVQGMDRATYLKAKFGGADRAAGVYDAVGRAGDLVGLQFAFDRIARTPSTLNSHRLIYWAHGEGVQDATVEQLFRRYFFDGADIGDPEILAEVAQAAGMDGAAVLARLAGDEDLELIRREDASARQMGINGVPCFIVDRKYAVSGAQDSPVFHQVFDLAIKEQVKQPAAPEPVTT